MFPIARGPQPLYRIILIVVNHLFASTSFFHRGVVTIGLPFQVSVQSSQNPIERSE